MVDWRLYLSAGIFVGITVVKLLFPDYTEDIRDRLVTVIDMDMDYTEAVRTVGRLITDDRIREVLHQIGTDDAFQVENEANVSLVFPTVQCVQPLPSPTVTPLEEPNEEALAEIRQAIEVFLGEQEAYSAYETPDKVFYDAMQIPFAYAEPVSGVCSSGFGYRVHPIEQKVLFHYGTDYEVVEGTAVCAFGPGKVTMIGEEPGYGKYVELTHEDGWKTLYAHCSEILVSHSDVIDTGETIALSGQTGRVTGPHLHFELTHDGMYTNPEFYFYDSEK